MLNDDNAIARLISLWRTRDLVEASAQAAAPGATHRDRSSWLVACPCGQWGATREDRVTWLALCRHLFPQLDRELDDWEHAHGRLYR
jgi:hypothetical protein